MDSHPVTVPTRELLAELPRADAALAAELAAELAETTDELPDPWQR